VPFHPLERMPVRSLFDIVAVVGPGLVGGSLGMAVRQRSLARLVVGVGRRRSSLRTAMDVGAVDRTTLDLAEGVSQADLVVLATPISAIGQLMPVVAASVKRGAVLTDVASTKQQVIGMVLGALKDRPDVAYVPAHPMAGSEKRGAAHAQAGLFERRVCILTPLPDAPREHTDRVRALWEAVGAVVHEMTPAEHDRLVARVSHLPHLAAAALVALLDAAEGRLAGQGLLDTTRIASGEPSLWRDICASNAPAVGAALDSYIRTLQGVRSMLAGGDRESLEAFLREAKRKRDELSAGNRP